MANNGETVETGSDFIFGGSKITTDGDCSHDIKSRLLLGRKVMTNLDSILKSRDITLPIKVHLLLLLLLLLSRFSRVQFCATPETAVQQAPPSLGFSRQEHWSGLPFYQCFFFFFCSLFIYYLFLVCTESLLLHVGFF